MADPLLLVSMGKYVPRNRDEGLELLKRAKANRVQYLVLKNIVKNYEDLRPLLNQLDDKRTEYCKEAGKVLRCFMKQDVDFMVIKDAAYPHLSVDLDILFRTNRDFEKASRCVKGLKIHIDPHVPHVREFKGAYAKIPAAELWRRSTFRELYGVKVRVPSNEDDVAMRLIHCIKHREIQLGDLLSILNAEFKESLLKRLVIECRASAVYSYMYYLFKYLGLERFRSNIITPFNPILQLQAKRQVHSAFPLKVPFLAVVLTAAPQFCFPYLTNNV